MSNLDSQPLTHARPTIGDVAREAGVSTATVDRVIHNRGGVAAAKVAAVQRALNVLRRQPAGSGRVARWSTASGPGLGLTFGVVLPSDAGPSTEFLAAMLASFGRDHGAEVNLHWVPKMNAKVLADALVQCARVGCSGVALMPLEHPLVRDAVDRLAARGIAVLSLTTELGGSRVFAHVGTDNRAAGRTAGFLMGRFVRRAGLIAVIWGGQLYRSHEEREIGFRSLVRAEFPELRVFDVVAGQDDAEGNYRQVQALLGEHADLVGIYSVGGGNRGIVRALRERGRDHDVVLIGHNLTPTTQAYLLDGVMDAVIHQDMRRAAQMAIAALINHREGRPISVERLPVEVIVKENLTGRVPQLDAETADREPHNPPKPETGPEV